MIKDTETCLKNILTFLFQWSENVRNLGELKLCGNY